MVPFILFSILLAALLLAYLQLKYSMSRGPTSKFLEEMHKRRQELHKALTEYIEETTENTLKRPQKTH